MKRFLTSVSALALACVLCFDMCVQSAKAEVATTAVAASAYDVGISVISTVTDAVGYYFDTSITGSMSYAISDLVADAITAGYIDATVYPTAEAAISAVGAGVSGAAAGLSPYLYVGVAAAAVLYGVYRYVAYIAPNIGLSVNINSYDALFNSILPDFDTSSINGTKFISVPTPSGSVNTRVFTPGFSSLPDGVIPLPITKPSNNDVFYSFADGETVIRGLSSGDTSTHDGTLVNFGSLRLYISKIGGGYLSSQGVFSTSSKTWNGIGREVRNNSIGATAGNYYESGYDYSTMPRYYYYFSLHNNLLYVYSFVQDMNDGLYYIMTHPTDYSISSYNYTFTKYISSTYSSFNFATDFNAVSNVTVDLSKFDNYVFPVGTNNEPIPFTIEYPSDLTFVGQDDTFVMSEDDVDRLIEEVVDNGDSVKTDNVKTYIYVIVNEPDTPSAPYDETWDNPETVPDAYPETPADEPTADPDPVGSLPGDIFAGPWHYVLETFDYAAEFISVFVVLMSSLPYAIKALFFAGLVLMLVFGIVVKLLK